MINRIPRWLKNKYSISLIAFLVLITFFENSLITQYSYRKDLNGLKAEKEYFNKQIEDTRRELNELTQNPSSLEKFAREKYFMKKDNEEIFVFTTK